MYLRFDFIRGPPSLFSTVFRGPIGVRTDALLINIGFLGLCSVYNASRWLCNLIWGIRCHFWSLARRLNALFLMQIYESLLIKIAIAGLAVIELCTLRWVTFFCRQSVICAGQRSLRASKGFGWGLKPKG